MIKKTCKGCYAAKTGGHPLSGEPYGCELGYKTDGEGHPREDAPKHEECIRIMAGWLGMEAKA